MLDYFTMGVVDPRLLNKSLGLLNPPQAVTAKSTDSVKSVLGRLRSAKIGCILLVNDDDKLEGIFSERDVVIKLPLIDGGFAKEPVCHYMTRDPQTAQMTTTVAFALNMMSHGGYRHLPIVDEEQMPVGIISVKNIVDYIAHSIMADLSQFEAC